MRRDSGIGLREEQGALRCQGTVVDLLFTESSTYNDSMTDDGTFAGKMDEVTIPVILGSKVTPDGALSPFVPRQSRVVNERTRISTNGRNPIREDSC